jgi:hypothetical protein
MNRVNVYTPLEDGKELAIDQWMAERQCDNYIITSKFAGRNGLLTGVLLELWVVMPPEHVLDFLLTFDSRLAVQKRRDLDGRWTIS